MPLMIQNVSKNFKEYQALKDISFSMNAGEIVSILGPSGCGKSTLLQLVAGLQFPSEGEISLNNQLLSSSTFLMQPEKRPVNMVFQDYALWPHMTVMQNVFYGAKLKKTKKSIIQEKKHFLFDLLRLNGLEDRFPAQISGGQQQRVAIARALATEPELLLMDEPLSNLDMQLRYEMRNELSYLLRRLGTTVLHVTHDPLEAYALADRILILKDGRIEQYGTPQEVRESPASLWVAGLLGMTNRLQGIALASATAHQQVVSIEGVTVVGKGQVIPESEALVMVDAEQMNVSLYTDDQIESEEVNRLSGKVFHSVYEGSKWRLIVDTAGGRVTVLHDKPIQKDHPVTVSFQVKDTHVFAEPTKKGTRLSGI